MWGRKPHSVYMHKLEYHILSTITKANLNQGNADVIMTPWGETQADPGPVTVTTAH